MATELLPSKFWSGLIASVIENITTFLDFCKALLTQGLQNVNFAEFGDNGPSGCSAVVVVNSRKWGHFGANAF